MKSSSLQSKHTQVKPHNKKLPAISGRLPPIERATRGTLTIAGPSSSRALVCLSKADEIQTIPPLIASFQVKDGDYGVGNKVSLWPYRGNRSLARQAVQDCPRSSSKAPLALQLEAFIRKEHRQYLLDHPDCSRLNTLHIFREGLSVFVEHFREYKPVLSLIRDEYDLTIKEVTEQMTQMGIENLESKSDRSVHAMELMHLKESLNAIIRNQEAQLRATQGMVHTLREQLSAAERSDAELRLEMEQKLKGFEEAQSTIAMLSKAMIEESSRTAEAMKASMKKDSEIELLKSRIKVLVEECNELKDYLRNQTRARMEMGGSLARSHDISPAGNAMALSAGSIPVMTEPNYSAEYVHRLLTRIDTLESEIAMLRNNRSSSNFISKSDGNALVTEAVNSFVRPSATNVPSQACRLENADFPIIREWLRLEGVGEAELESSDTLLPPGLCQSEELAFLKACVPVKNKHLRQDVILKLIDDIWEARERQMSFSSFRNFLLEWLTSKSGSLVGMRELGINLLQGCQRNSHHPDCRVLLQVLRGFLPEELVRSCRQLLRSLLSTCEISTESLNGEISISALSDVIRSLWPEKYHSHMLQLCFYAYRHSSQPGKVSINELLGSNSYFITLLKHQYFREVEEFTLCVVEKVRAASEGGSGMIPVSSVIQIITKLDDGLTGEVISGLLSDAFQQTIMDVRSSDVSLRVDDLLQRLRGNILLRRATPPD
ncbi:unnamed protein product [Phytomonas sp. EM1]|nr:unnamed protein product [Phytomonas sp. EM1]|eukprot:CCW61023.1 unnamed protein product [Phytomonas sp. isolate EM1]